MGRSSLFGLLLEYLVMCSIIGIKIVIMVVEFIMVLSMVFVNISIISILVVELLLFWLI